MLFNHCDNLIAGSMNGSYGIHRWNEFYIKKWANVVEFATKLERMPRQKV